MKKILLYFSVLIMLTTVFTGCSGETQSKPEQGNIELEQNPEDETAGDSNPSESPQQADSELYETKIDSGRYQGQADSNFVEIKISGVPDAIAAKVFMLSDEMKERHDQLELKKDDEIKFSYYQDQNQQLVIVEIEKMAATTGD